MEIPENTAGSAKIERGGFLPYPEYASLSGKRKNSK
jgi:hypothetical protein